MVSLMCLPSFLFAFFACSSSVRLDFSFFLAKACALEDFDFDSALPPVLLTPFARPAAAADPVAAAAVPKLTPGFLLRSPRTFFLNGTLVRTAVCTMTPLLFSGRRTVSVVALCMIVTDLSFRFDRFASSFVLRIYKRSFN